MMRCIRLYCIAERLPIFPPFLISTRYLCFFYLCMLNSIGSNVVCLSALLRVPRLFSKSSTFFNCKLLLNIPIQNKCLNFIVFKMNVHHGPSGPYLPTILTFTDKIYICPEPTWPRDPPVTITNYVIYYCVKIKLYFLFCPGPCIW